MEAKKRRAIEDLKKIRETTKFNMFMERRKVIQYANENQYFNLVSYCGNNSKKYLELLKDLK